MKKPNLAAMTKAEFKIYKEPFDPRLRKKLDIVRRMQLEHLRSKYHSEWLQRRPLLPMQVDDILRNHKKESIHKLARVHKTTTDNIKAVIDGTFKNISTEMELAWCEMIKELEPEVLDGGVNFLSYGEDMRWRTGLDNLPRT